MKRLVYLIMCLCVLSANSQGKKPRSGRAVTKVEKTQKNLSKLSIEQRVDSLMRLMTLEEKIGQTVQFTSSSDVTGPVLDNNYMDYLKSGHVGSIFNAVGSDYTRKLQKIAVEETRLGIPLIFGYDVIHGYKTIFPIPLGESCSWDLDLMEKTARAAATEAASAGIHWTFAPMVDIARDPRWGRVTEGAGEDAYLGALIAKARIKGFQGADLSMPNTILACAKHFAAYGAAEAGRDYNTVDMSLNRLHNVYLPPFKAAVEAGVATFMTAFNEVNGTPATANPYLLNEILKKQWGFEGFVVTDFTSMNEMIHHGYAADLKQAGELSMNAGVDMDMQGSIYLNYMKQSIQEGKISEERLNDAVRRILTMKFKLGLFEDPYRYCDEKRERHTLLSKEYLNLSREAAQKSIVLLKNNNAVLPLAKNKSVALIGPLADDQHHIIGSWSGQGDRNGVAVSVKEGFDRAGINYAYAKGCEIEGGDQSGFAKAIEAAQKSDVAIMVMGESERMSGEAASRSDIRLPGHQKELIAAIKKTGKPLVLVLMNGRPLDLSWEDSQVDAILEAWFPGTEGGLAVTDVIFGDYNPSGKLTMSFPRSVGQIPVYYNAKNTGRPSDIKGADKRYTSKYIDIPNTPLYPFGFGLSYTNFKYSAPTLSSKDLFPDSKITLRVEISNTGNYDGQEVTQLYIRDKVASITRPVKELKGFEKVFIKKGETKAVTFEISSKDLAFFKEGRGFAAEEGAYEVFVAGDSNHSATDSFFFHMD